MARRKTHGGNGGGVPYNGTRASEQARSHRGLPPHTHRPGQRHHHRRHTAADTIHSLKSLSTPDGGGTARVSARSPQDDTHSA